MTAPRREHVPAWLGSLALLFGGIGAQLAGLLVLIVAVGVLISEGVSLDPTVLQPALERLITTFWVLGPSIALTGGTMVLVAFAVPLLARVPARSALALRGAPWPAFVVAPLGILALGPTSDGLRRAMVAVAPQLTFGTLEGLDRLATSAPLWMVVPVMALIPGFAEELLFRGMFQGSIRRPALAIFFSGLLFAAYHTDPHHVVAVLPLGFYLAWLRHQTGSTFVPITAHVANNATAVIAVVTLGDSPAADAFEWWWMPVGWTIAAGAAGVIWFTTKDRNLDSPFRLPETETETESETETETETETESESETESETALPRSEA